MPFTIIRNDITKLHVDAIVNAANTRLQMGSGVCGAIFNGAGADKLQMACNPLAPIRTGEAVITPGFKLPAKYIIHTAGPVYKGGTYGEEALLRACYINSLEIAIKHNCESIAFPLISSGIYGYPKGEALQVASRAIRDFISEHDMDVSLVVFDKEAVMVSAQLLGAVKSYIDEHYTEEQYYSRRRLLEVEALALAEESISRDEIPIIYKVPAPSAAAPNKAKETKAKETSAVVDAEMDAVAEMEMDASADMEMDASADMEMDASADMEMDASADMEMDEIADMGTDVAVCSSQHLGDIIDNLDQPFSAALLRLIDVTGKKDAEIYRRANIDRRLFSKIRSNENYAPSKPTVLAFAIALELSLAQTEDLLNRAGFTLSHSRKFDVIVEYFIQHRLYDVFRINEVLFNYDQPLLGGH